MSNQVSASASASAAAGAGAAVPTAARVIRKVLIANRGEIACRVMRSCAALGLATVAVYSEADKGALHARSADQAVCVGPAAALESYLVMDRIIQAAQQTGADAIHPGYGFLSENAEFARRCAKAGITFVGPRPETIDGMGNKKQVKDRLLKDAPNVPVIPGYNGDDQTLATLQREGKRIGCPLLVKAAAGGGGKGLRVVLDPSEMAGAIESVKSEAKNAFGDDGLLLERYFSGARHIEIQIFGDEHGNVIALGERDCSVQRRYQKVVEETPSPFMTQKLREDMCKTAVEIGQLTGYVGAGTVEFLVDHDRKYYFLEVNTRLQVEHPVTEMVQDLDLVQLQLQVAQGVSLLDLGLDGGRTKGPAIGGGGGGGGAVPVAGANGRDASGAAGHAIECRLYAEDPSNNFFPSTGTLAVFRPARIEGVRYDTGVVSGSEISVYYDPMIAKIIAAGPSRAVALARMRAALERTVVLGVRTNKAFLLAVLNQPDFAAGDYTTKFIGRHFPTKVISKVGQLCPKGARGLAVAASLFDRELRTSRANTLRHIPGGFSNGPRRFQSTKFDFKDAGLKATVSYRLDLSTPSSLGGKSLTVAERQALLAAPRFEMKCEVRSAAEEAEEEEKLENASFAAAAIAERQSKAVPFSVSVLDINVATGVVELEMDGIRCRYIVANASDGSLQGPGADRDVEYFVHSNEIGGHAVAKQSRFSVAGAGGAGGAGAVTAPMPCKILRVCVENGTNVKKGDLVVVIESMKMEMKLYAEGPGVATVCVSANQVVDSGAVLVELAAGGK